jgi:acetyl-CoA synthase
MSEIIKELGEKGAKKIFDLTNQELSKAVTEYGENKEIGFPDTAYYLPLINALLNIEINKLADCKNVLMQIEKLMKNEAADNGLKIEAVGGLLNLGLATIFSEEILAAIFYLRGIHPKNGYTGFLADTLLRSLGIQLVDGRIAGIAVILGYPKDTQAAVNVIRELQSKNIVSILAGNIEGKSLRDILLDNNVEIGLEDYIVPLGEDYLSVIYAIDWAIRASLTYGGCKSGQWQKILDYAKVRVPAFVMLFGYIDEVIVATGLGALALGFPIVTDLDVPQIAKIETTLYESLVTEKDYKRIASCGIEIRGIKVKVRHLNLPVPYAAAFEGERVRRERLYVEFGGKASMALEYLISGDSKDIEDGKVEIIGPDIDKLESGKKSMPLAIVVEVSGRKMQKDFEPVLERQIHRYTNYAMGVMHIGQRDMCWIRVSKEAFDKGFRLKHIGIFLHAMLHEEYGAIVDKVQVKLYTRQSDVERISKQVRKTYEERDTRISGMTDESVDTFYSCTLCQSFAPNHVCIVTPERLGLCGAYSWLDAKACYEITPTGPNQPVEKGKVLDQKRGQWQNVNDFVFNKSNKTVKKVSMYSLMDNPQTSCGCFECIVAIIPEANGFMVVHRDYSGMTPCGMSFTTLAGSVGGGVQTPGFLGIGRLYILSKKFISADGGLARIVWLPKELKDSLGDKLKQRCQEIGQPDLLDKIADESQAKNSEELLKFLTKVEHPALTMPPLL